MKLLVILIFSAMASMVGTAEEVELSNDKLKVVISSLGAELQSVKSRSPEREYLWQGDPKYWKRRAPLMFPVNVRFKDDQFVYRNSTYQMPILGLAHSAQFKVRKLSESIASFSFESDHSTQAHYPFMFRFTVTYELRGNRLLHSFLLENRGDNTLYYALGGHPGFRLPMEDGLSRGDYRITFSEPMWISRQALSGGLIQPEAIPFLQGENFLSLGDSRVPGQGMLLLNPTARRIGVAKRGGPPFLEVELGDFPNVNIWSPPGMPFVCIEPQIGHHDLQGSPLDIEQKTYLMELKPQQKESYSFAIVIN